MQEFWVSGWTMNHIDVRMISTVPYYWTLEDVQIDSNQHGKEMKFQREKKIWQGKMTLFYMHFM